MEVPTEKVVAVLRAVPEVAADRDWVRGRLMEDRGGRPVFAWGRTDQREPKLWTRDEQGSNRPRDCASVAACCTIGYVELASICATGVEPELADAIVWDAAFARLTETLLELGWAESLIRQWWEDNDVSAYNDLDYTEWRAALSVEEAAEIGDEGLVALWNDTACEGREQSLELIARAAERPASEA